MPSTSIELASKLSECLKNPRAPDHGEALISLRALLVDLADQHQSSYLPSARTMFLLDRERLKHYEAQEKKAWPAIDQIAKRLLAEVFPHDIGDAPAQRPKQLATMSDADLRDIVERAYAELSLILFPSGAWKSTVILAGSILEALLFDRLFRDVASEAASMAAASAPRTRAGASISKDDWRLADLVKVAAELGTIPTHQERLIDQSLRDYRNFVHPKKEVREQYACGESQATVAKGALDGVIEHLEAHP